jgi:Protein of unknown function (DUF3097)
MQEKRGTLAGPVGPKERLATMYPVIDAVVGMHIAHRGSRFAGVVKSIRTAEVSITGATGLVRNFPLESGAFLVDGAAVSLQRPKNAAAAGPVRTASGSIAVPNAKARVARAARIVVEGIHDAELIEKVWGDDLRIEGVVVERLDGLDNVEAFIQEFRPGPTRRLGVLVDHLVAGSKEARIAQRAQSEYVMFTGTPYIDVWTAVRPKVMGLERWPVIPKGQSFKEGTCAALGVSDPRVFWRELLSKVQSYKDLEASVVGAVEQLIDFVTAT